MISYFGGKANMVEWINTFIPRDIKKYAEPFSGAFWTYINTKYQFPKLDKIVYNDFNGHMANLYACLSKPDVFLKKLEKELDKGGFLYTDEKDKDKVRDFYKDIYYSYKHDRSVGNFLDNPPKNMPDFDAGAMYAFLITSAFNGCHPRSAGCSPISSSLKPKITALVNKLKNESYINKLNNITDVHSEDFEEIFKKYDSKDTFFYVDPPYFSPNVDGDDTGKRAGWYGTKDFNYESHMRILNILKNCKGRWALSYYYFKELEDLLPKDKYTWVSKDFYRSSASFADTEQEMGTELLIMNYKLSDDEIEENKKFLNVKTKNVESDSKKVKKELGKYLKNVLNNDFMSEKLIDEIEEENGGAFINSNISEDDKNDMIEEISDFISRQKNLDPDTRQIVNENFSNMIDTINDEDAIDDDDFWNS